MMPTRRRIGVIGAGMGGLAAAITLARQGHDVVLLEAATRPGGKLRQVSVGGVMIEAGPAALTLRGVFDTIFESAGTRLDDHLRLTPRVQPVRHIFADGSILDLPMDAEDAEAAIGRFAGAAEARGYRAFRARARAAFTTLESTLLSRARPSALALASQAGIGRLLATGPFTTLWDALGEHFADPRLRQVFARTAGYVGTSPLQAPATLMLIADAEHQGGWWVEGGLSRLAEALADVATSQGVRLRLGVRVAEVLVAGGRVSGLRLMDNETIPCDAVVANVDSAALAAGRLGVAASRAVAPVALMARSFSAITWAVHGPLHAPGMPAECVLHGEDARAEYTALAYRGRMPASPSITVFAPDRFGPGLVGRDAIGGAPPGDAERLLVMVHAPARGDQGQPDVAATTACGAAVFARLAQAGILVAREAEHITGPVQFEALFPGTGGALYGPAVQGWQATFSRPTARTKLPGLYLAGGGTHPGAGVAMAARSGTLAAEELLGA